MNEFDVNVRFACLRGLLTAVTMEYIDIDVLIRQCLFHCAVPFVVECVVTRIYLIIVDFIRLQNKVFLIARFTNLHVHEM